MSHYLSPYRKLIICAKWALFSNPITYIPYSTYYKPMIYYKPTPLFRADVRRSPAGLYYILYGIVACCVGGSKGWEDQRVAECSI